MCKLPNNMPQRVVIFTVTAAGLRLALRLRGFLGGAATIFARTSDDNSPLPPNCITYEKLSVAAAENFARFDALIFVMSTGIAVRMIAPHIVSKLSDPAVLVADERGRYIISLLSGHIGGANDLTRYLAAQLNAAPVITTATDSHGITAPDVVAAHLGLDPWPKENIKRVNMALLDGDDIPWLIDVDLPRQNFWRQALFNAGITAKKPDTGTPNQVGVFLTERTELPFPGALALTPRLLIAGVGCRRGASAESIMAALSAACQLVGRDVTFITALATTTLKSDEIGLTQAAAQLAVKIYCFDNAALSRQITGYGLHESPFVRKTVGVGNVAEAAALAFWHDKLKKTRRGVFALGKTKYEKVTVALLWQNLIRPEN